MPFSGERHGQLKYTWQCLHLCIATVRYQPEEDVVSLVVESDSSPALEVWILAEDGSKHAPQSVTQPGAKVVENELWSMRACTAMMLHVCNSFSQPETCTNLQFAMMDNMPDTA